MGEFFVFFFFWLRLSSLCEWEALPLMPVVGLYSLACFQSGQAEEGDRSDEADG